MKKSIETRDQERTAFASAIVREFFGSIYVEAMEVHNELIRFCVDAKNKDDAQLVSSRTLNAADNANIDVWQIETDPCERIDGKGWLCYVEVLWR